MNKDEEEENEKSIYNYNMIFNRINNYDEDIKFNTNLISDIDLQNFDPERYEYYTNLLYIYNKDPKTLYDLLNKYYNVKSMHEKEKGIIKYIYDYARKLKDAEGEGEATDAAAEGGGGGGRGSGGGGGSMRRRNKRRRNRQAGGGEEEKTWQNTFINVLKNKMPAKAKKVEKKKEPTHEASDDEEDDDVEYYIEKEGVSDLSKKIKLLEEKIGEIKKMKKDSLGSTFYKDLKSRLNKKKEKGKDEENEEKTPESSVSSSATKSSLVASAEPSASAAAPSSVASAANDTSATEEIPLGSVVDELVNIVNVLTAQVGTQSAAPVAAPVAASAEPSSSAAASLEVLNTLTDLANTLQVKIENSTSEEKKISKKQEADLALTISSLQALTSALIGGGMKGGTGNSDEQLKMKYLDNNKDKGITTWKKIKELKSNLKTQPENIDENNKIARLSQDIDNYNSSDKGKKDNDYIIQQLNNFENDPKNPLDELAITFDDRLVFIIATFFIRYITIIIVQWCIDINIIKTFYEGFIYYAIIYIIIFWFVVLFINIDNGYDVKYMNFNGIINSIRTLFYYFYMGTNGISRLLVHTSLIIILIIIPIILNIKRKADYVDDEQTETEKILNNEERKQLSKSLSLFTMFIWLFTSIIATKF
jgi:hypothetical protein